MKSKRIAITILVLSLVLGAGAASPAVAQTVGTADARMALFYSALQPYGEWVYNDTYGWCWYPNNIQVDWRPYTEGRWIYTDSGWTFDADAPYGWATFHYGRWFYDSDQGWLWYPDTEWAPCWVVWRYNKNHVGWAPMTPECVWRDNGGLSTGQFNPDEIPLNYYTFCHVKDFAGANLERHFLLIAKNATYIKKTQYVPGTLNFSNQGIHNELPFHGSLVQATGHDFQRIKLVTVDSWQARGTAGSEYRVFRPEVPSQAPKTPLYGGPKPKALSMQHTQQNQALVQYQATQLRSLQQNHAAEKQNPPDNADPTELSKQHSAELQAQQEQQQKEHRLVQNEQQRQVQVATAPRAPTQRQHYVLPTSEPEQAKKLPPDNGQAGSPQKGY